MATRAQFEREIAQKHPEGAMMEREVNGKIQRRHFKLKNLTAQLIHGRNIENPWHIADDQSKPQAEKPKATRDSDEKTAKEIVKAIEVSENKAELEAYLDSEFATVKKAAEKRIKELA
jgi:hypothetical protein